MISKPSFFGRPTIMRQQLGILLVAALLVAAGARDGVKATP